MRTRLNLKLGRIRAFLRTSADDRDLDQELETHLTLLEQHHLQRGMTTEQARRAARLELGGLAQLRDAHRKVRGLPLLENFLQDLRFATRLLAKSPGFSAVAILTLALGIGANTAIFTVVSALLVKPLPYKDPDRLVALSTISQRYNSDRMSVSYADILDWKAKTDLFEAVAAINPQSFDVTSGDEPERIRGLAADREYFRVFTDPPLLGRAFQAEEDEPEANRVIVLSRSRTSRCVGKPSRYLTGDLCELIVDNLQ